MRCAQRCSYLTLKQVVHILTIVLRKAKKASSYLTKANVKLSQYLTNQALRHEGVWGNGCIDPCFLFLGTSWRRVVSSTRPAALSQRKEPPAPIGYEAASGPSRTQPAATSTASHGPLNTCQSVVTIASCKSFGISTGCSRHQIAHGKHCVAITQASQCELCRKMRNDVFWNVAPCGSPTNRRLGGTSRLHHQYDKNRRAKNVSSN
jgi:hypothetical protein